MFLTSSLAYAAGDGMNFLMKNIIQNKTSDLNEFNSQILINHHSRLYRNIADFKHVLKSKLKVFNRSRRLIYRVFKV